jgi:hypothetical protein
MRLFAGVLAGLSLLSGIAQAQNLTATGTLTAGSLYKTCLSSGALGADYDVCNVYFRGLVDALFIMQEMNLAKKPVCMPGDASISVEDARRFFNRWMTLHPGNASNSAGLVAAMAVIGAYPC